MSVRFHFLCETCKQDRFSRDDVGCVYRLTGEGPTRVDLGGREPWSGIRIICTECIKFLNVTSAPKAISVHAVIESTGLGYNVDAFESDDQEQLADWEIATGGRTYTVFSWTWHPRRPPTGEANS